MYPFQAISWIFELCEVMLTTQTHIGQTPLEIDNLQEEHKQVENTAAVSTHPYYKNHSPWVFFVYLFSFVDHLFDNNSLGF